MNLQPYKVVITNKTPEQLACILNTTATQDYNMVKDLFLPNFGIDDLTELFIASPETFSRLLKYYQKLGIEVKYSVKQGKDFLVANQNHINEKAEPEFVCASIQYMLDHCTQDDVYQKINSGNTQITEVDQYVLENN